jgi:beta-glucanase (GH16 family)
MWQNYFDLLRESMLKFSTDTQTRQIVVRNIAYASFVIALSACGGGGGNDSADTSLGNSTDASIEAAKGGNKNRPNSSTPATESDATAPYGQDANAYTLTFQEEFEGTALDTSKWNNHIWYESPSQAQDYIISNGSLKIFPQRDPSGKFVHRHFTTDKKYYQTYGYFEMEAKLPVGKGLWPAFWMINHDDERVATANFFPPRPEIDIMEAYSGDTTGYWADKNFHPTAYAATVWPRGIQNPTGEDLHRVMRPGDLSAGFHKYAVKWEPNKQTFYFDGKEVASYNVTMATPNRMFMLLSLQYGSASGNPDNTTPTGQSNSYEIKYVRAWQFK